MEASAGVYQVKQSGTNNVVYLRGIYPTGYIVECGTIYSGNISSDPSVAKNLSLDNLLGGGKSVRNSNYNRTSYTTYTTSITLSNSLFGLVAFRNYCTLKINDTNKTTYGPIYYLNHNRIFYR